MKVLTTADIEVALVETARKSSPGTRIQASVSKLAALEAAVRVAAASCETPRRQLVAAAATALAHVAKWRPLSGATNLEFAKVLARTLVGKFGGTLLWAQHEPLLDDVVSQAIDDDEIMGCLVADIERCLVLPARAASREADHLLAFVGTPLTGVDGISLSAAEALASKISQVLAEHDIATHQAIQHTHPIRNPELALNPRIRRLDGNVLRAAQLIVAVVDRPSTGEGMMLSYGERSLSIELIFVSGDAGESPLLRGSLADVEFVSLDDIEDNDIAGVVEDFIRRRKADLARHRDEHIDRTVFWTPVYERFLARLSEVGGSSVVQRLPAGLSRGRVAELLSSVEDLCTGSLHELHGMAWALDIRIDVRIIGSEGRKPAA